MAVHLVRPHRRGPRDQTGVGGYADALSRILSDSDAEYDETECDLSFDLGLSGLIGDAVCSLKTAVRASKADTVHYTYEALGFSMPFCRSRKVVTFHHVVDRSEGVPRLWYAAWRVSAAISVRCADMIIAISSQTASEVVESFGADPEKVIVVPYMSNVRLSPSPDVRRKRIIGSMGSLTERKNYPAMLRVFSLLIRIDGCEDLELRICGRGSLRGELEAYAQSLGIGDKVSFVQDLDEDGLRQFYSSCLICLYTSSHEGSGMMTPEAQACGTPVLYLRGSRMPEEMLVAAVACDGEEDMARRAGEILNDSDLYERISRDGLDFVKTLREGFVETMRSIYLEAGDDEWVL